MFELRVLGTLDLRDRAGGGPIAAVVAQPKRAALLAYLAAATPRGAHLRESLLLLFWPNSTEDRARNSLNQAVFNLRRVLGEAVITGAGEELRVNPQLVWCDAVAFDDAAARGDHREAVLLYGGDLLPGFHLDECLEFERWLDAERARMRSRAVAAALALAAEEERTGNGVAAIEVLRRCVTWAPYDEPAVAQLVRLLAELGDRPGAIREYERFETLVRHELALEPSRELAALAAAVRSGAGSALRRADQPAAKADDTARLAGAELGGAEREGDGPLGAGRAASEWAGGNGARVEHVTAQPVRSRRQRVARTASLAAGVTVVAVLAAFALVRVGRSSAAEDEPALDRQRVLVAAFENRTGDNALDPVAYMAADWIAQGVARNGIARVVPFSTIVQETPHLRAEGSAPERAVPAANRQLARRLGAAIVVGGSYYRTGDSLVVQAQVVDVRTGELLRAIDEVRGPVASPARGMEELQRRSLGALATLFDTRLESWRDPGGQPAGLEAYRLFSDGMSMFMQGMAGDWGDPQRNALFAGAALKLEAANAADSAFVLPLLWASYAHMNSENLTAARAVVARLEGRMLSPWNRAVLDHLQASLAGDEEATYVAARHLAELSPDSEWLWKLALAAMRTGRMREAQAVFARIDPNRGWIKGSGSFWRLRVEPHHVLGDHARALEEVRRGLSEHPEDVWLRNQELFALGALGRDDEIVTILKPQLAVGEVRALWQLNIALEELYGHRRTSAAHRVVREMLPVAESLALADGRPFARGELARTLQLAGMHARAAALYADLLRSQPANAEFRTRAAMLALKRGDGQPALETIQWLGALDGERLVRTFPRPQLGYWGSAEGWLALLQARLLAHLGESDRAVALLRQARQRGLTHTYLHLHDDPDFDPLRRHPAFQQLLRSRD